MHNIGITNFIMKITAFSEKPFYPLSEAILIQSVKNKTVC